MFLSLKSVPLSLNAYRPPNFIVRMNPEHSAAARQAARDAGKQVGQWLEEAITEKLEREQEAKDVNAVGIA